jgi:hypothetical protein
VKEMKASYMATHTGSSTNLTLRIGKYEISITSDNSCTGYKNDMIRHYIAVYDENNKNVTAKIFNEKELISEYETFGSEDNLLKAIEYCKSR